MLTPEEMKLLYYIGKNDYTGRGEIIDAGAFCGGSAYALAAGLNDNPVVSSTKGRVHSFDLFRADESYTVAYIQNLFYSRFDEDGRLVSRTREVEVNESFLDIYLFQTQRYAESIQVHQGSLLEKRWGETEVEVLFIDVAKTQELQSHLFALFGDRLIVNRTILIQQDYHHAWHPYIHVAMEYLRPYFEILVSNAGATRAYRLISPLPSQALKRVIDYDFSAQERRDLLAQAVALCVPGEALVLDLVRVRQAVVDSDRDGIDAVAAEVIARHGSGASAGYVRESLRALLPPEFSVPS